MRGVEVAELTYMGDRNKPKEMTFPAKGLNQNIEIHGHNIGISLFIIYLISY